VGAKLGHEFVRQWPIGFELAAINLKPAAGSSDAV
jgi:hypothetical protein